MFDKNFAVIGLGDTGLSIIRYLSHKKANIVRVFDTRETPPNTHQITLPTSFGALKYSDFTDIDIIVISPGISICEPLLQKAIRNNKQVIGDIELFALEIKEWNSKVIGITGSNGKTTVTSLTGYLTNYYGLNTLVAGNIGKTVLDSYLEIISSGLIPEVIVLELSSFQLETTYSLNLDAGVVLNISEDHIDRYRDLLEYAYTKANIFNNCKVQVLNSDDEFVKAMSRHNKTCKFFGENAKFSINHNQLQINGVDYLDAKELNLVGRHNYFNALASLALLDVIAIDIQSPKIKDGLRSFKGLEHRMEKVTTHNGILYIEDSKGTNVGAVVAGISGLDCLVHLILGGDGKGQDFSPLKVLVEKKCKSVAIIGQDKLEIAKVLEGINIPIQVFVNLPEAVAFCIKNAKSGDAVVLSPACASWDMFDNYKHRAKVFIESIHANIS